MAGIVVDSVCRIKKWRWWILPTNLFGRECEYKEKNKTKKKCQIKGKIVIPDSNESDESDDEFTE